MLIDKQFIQRSNAIILVISFIFALLIGSGFYGFGNDYYAIYYKSNVDWGQTFDRFGWIVTTLAINGKHIGVHTTTFILSFSVGYLLREQLRFKNIYSLFFFIFLYIIMIHTWPIIMSTSNAMRQGLCMSFIFIALSSSHKSYLWTIIFVLLATFAHKSGPLFALIILLAFCIHTILKNQSYNTKVVVHFFLGIFLMIISYVFIFYTLRVEEGTKIIDGDFRIPFILIAITYVSLSFFYKWLTSNITNLSLYYFSFISPMFLMNGLNWEYERLGMMMLIPYILSFGGLLDRPSNKVYLIITFLALLQLTIYMGMYESFR
tara:strand:+ start:1320 stop:2276 length:957 start_codon:yes stop_codon:yes gene_type:complete